MKGKEGEEIRRNFSQKYTVLPVPNSATVAADLMNVLYAGYANPISISVPGVPANAISASMSGGSFVSKGNGHFVATPSAVGRDVTIHVTARDKDRFARCRLLFSMSENCQILPLISQWEQTDSEVAVWQRPI